MSVLSFLKPGKRKDEAGGLFGAEGEEGVKDAEGGGAVGRRGVEVVVAEVGDVRSVEAAGRDVGAGGGVVVGVVEGHGEGGIEADDGADAGIEGQGEVGERGAGESVVIERAEQWPEMFEPGRAAVGGGNAPGVFPPPAVVVGEEQL